MFRFGMVEGLEDGEAGIAVMVAMPLLFCSWMDGMLSLLLRRRELEKARIDCWLTLAGLRGFDDIFPACVSSLRLGASAPVVLGLVPLGPASSIAFRTALPNSSSAKSLRPLSAI